MTVSHALFALIAHCAPTVHPRTMSAIVAYESGGRPFAIGDNTARVSYTFPSRAKAEEIASELLRRGHDLDIGYAQINVSNFAAYGLDLHAAFEPCRNIRVGSRILARAYVSALRRYGSASRALPRALSAYNTGTFSAGLGYARSVYSLARRLTFKPNRLSPE